MSYASVTDFILNPIRFLSSFLHVGGGSWTTMRVLVVEDEVKMAALLRRGLTEQGYAVDVATTGEEALWLASETTYAAIVLDIVLDSGAGPDGFEVCRRLREAGHWSPVLMLTARDGVSDRVRGLDLGADLGVAGCNVAQPAVAAGQAGRERAARHSSDLLCAPVNPVPVSNRARPLDLETDHFPAYPVRLDSR